MAYETIKYDVADQILTITLNRPDKLNAFNQQMMTELIDAFDKADADDNVRAIIVTGEGRGFCAGADLSSGGDTFDRDAKRGAESCPRRRRAGSCRASSVSRRRWNGAIPGAFSRRRKPSPAVSSAALCRRIS